MSGDGLLELAVVGAPDLDEFVGGRGGQPLPVGTELDGGDRLRVSRQRELERVVGADAATAGLAAAFHPVDVGGVLGVPSSQGT